MKTNILLFILITLVLGISCNKDEDDFKPEIPTEGTIFKVAVDIESSTIDALGGKDVVERILYTNFKLVSSAFNSSGQFNEMHFILDKLSEFEGTSKTQIAKSHSGSDFVLIINKYTTDDYKQGWYKDNNTVILTDESVSLESIFSHDGIKYFTYAMALARGAIDPSSGNVNLLDNPVVGREYSAASSVVNSKDIDNTWDELTAKLINLSGSGKAVGVEDVLVDSISLTIKKLVDGSVLSDVNVTVFPVRWGSGTVMKDSIFNGKTDINGKISFNSSKNIFLIPDSYNWENEKYFSNLLIRIEKFNVYNYFFVPITEPILSGVDGNKAYNKVYEFDLTTLEDMLVTRYTFDNQADLFANDSNIAVTSNASFTDTAKVGNGALKFEGTQYMILAKDDSISAGKDYSVSFWFNTTFDSGDQNAFWTMSKWSGDIANDPWVPGGLTFRYKSDNINYDVGWEGGSSGTSSIIDGNWHQLLTTVKYTSETNADISMYIDGVLVFSGNSNIIVPTWGEYFPDWKGQSEVDEFVVKIGYSNTNNDAATPFTGFIDDVRIFNQALDNDWAYELYNEQ